VSAGGLASASPSGAAAAAPPAGAKVILIVSQSFSDAQIHAIVKMK
jgi:hypothetical protein